MGLAKQLDVILLNLQSVHVCFVPKKSSSWQKLIHFVCRYKENPNIANESAHAQAREALKKYLHYFERWENHSRSMKLEAVTLETIKNWITEKVMSRCGTWIDWQYLFDAAKLLAKCRYVVQNWKLTLARIFIFRYTLQYTYPYAYYIEPCPRKELVRECFYI